MKGRKNIDCWKLEIYFIYKFEWGSWRWKNLMQYFIVSLVFTNDFRRTHFEWEILLHISQRAGDFLFLCSIVCSAKALVLSTNTVFTERENANSVIQAGRSFSAYIWGMWRPCLEFERTLFSFCKKNKQTKKPLLFKTHMLTNDSNFHYML